MSVFFGRIFAKGLECFAQVFVVLRPASTVRLVLLSRGWSLATITCVKLSVGPITHVESYGQVHKSWRTGSCLLFGNCKCYYLLRYDLSIYCLLSDSILSFLLLAATSLRAGFQVYLS